MWDQEGTLLPGIVDVIHGVSDKWQHTSGNIFVLDDVSLHIVRQVWEALLGVFCQRPQLIRKPAHRLPALVNSAVILIALAMASLMHMTRQ